MHKQNADSTVYANYTVFLLFCDMVFWDRANDVTSEFLLLYVLSTTELWYNQKCAQFWKKRAIKWHLKQEITPFGLIDLINGGRNVFSVVIFFLLPKGAWIYRVISWVEYTL